MHIPDGFLDTKTWLAMTLISGVILAVVLKHLKRANVVKRIPLIGMTAALVFAAQMLNFPVAGGTSGHFMGGVFCCIILGPWTGFLAMSMVLIVQALLFQDGGITALGANIFNMGLIGSVVGFYLYGFFRLLVWGDRTRPVAYALASWTSLMLAATFAAFELSLSGTIKLSVVLPTMLSAHAIIGIGEAAITTAALMALWRIKPDIMRMRKF